MILRGIVFSLYRIKDEVYIESIQKEKGLTYIKAVQHEYEQNWSTKTRNFYLETRCMCAMLERLFGKIKTESTGQITFQCISEKSEFEEFPESKNVGGDFEFPVIFPLDEFLSNSEKKKIFIIDSIKNNIALVGSQIGISQEDIDRIISFCEMVKQLDYRNEYLWKKPYKHNQYFTQFKVVHEVEYAEVFLLLMNRKKEVLKEFSVVKTLPDEVFFRDYLVKPEWISETEVRIVPGNTRKNPVVLKVIDDSEVIHDGNSEKKVPQEKEKSEFYVKLKDPHSTLQFQFFWDTMDLCDWKFEGNDEKVLKPVKKYLSELDDEKIFEFDDMMTELLYHLDRRELAKACEEISGYFSEDDFLYSRCVALINGPRYYSRVLNGVETHPWSNEFESILYLPQKAWAAKHRKSADKYPHSASLSYETGSNTGGWEE